MGVVEVGPARGPAAELTLDRPADSDWPGLRVVAAGLAQRVCRPVSSSPSALASTAGESELPDGLHWDLECGGVSRDGGTLSLPARAAGSLGDERAMSCASRRA